MGDSHIQQSGCIPDPACAATAMATLKLPAEAPDARRGDALATRMGAANGKVPRTRSSWGVSYFIRFSWPAGAGVTTAVLFPLDGCA